MKKFFAVFLAAVLVSAAFCAAFLTPMRASAEGVNLAQGKQIFGADPTVGNQYTDKYNASLVDGIAADEFDPNGAPGEWFSYYYNSNEAFPSNAAMTDNGLAGEFTVDLEGTASVESVRLHMFATDAKKNSGIQPPYRIVVEHSADNAAWSAFGERTDFSTCKDIDWVEIAADAAVQARYIKVTIYYAGPTLLLNEVQIIGEMGEGGTSNKVPSDVRYEVFNLTPLDAAVDWYQDGIVVAIPNDSGEPLTAASGDYALRYMFILIFDKNGVCTEVGNNLLTADDERAPEYPQHDITIPAGGFAIVFYYNANEGPSNLALYEYYEALGGTVYSNETGAAAAGKNYTAEIEKDTVTVYFGTASDAPDTPPEEPSEESSAEPSEEPSEEPSAPAEPSAGTSEPASESASEPAASSAETTSDAPDASSQSDEDGGSSHTGIIVGIIVAVAAVIGAAVAIVAVKKKKG